MTENSRKMNAGKLLKAELLYKKFDHLSALEKLTSRYIKPEFSPELLEAMDDAWFLFQSLNNDQKSLALIDDLSMALVNHILGEEE